MKTFRSSYEYFYFRVKLVKICGYVYWREICKNLYWREICFYLYWREICRNVYWRCENLIRQRFYISITMFCLCAYHLIKIWKNFRGCWGISFSYSNNLNLFGKILFCFNIFLAVLDIILTASDNEALDLEVGESGVPLHCHYSQVYSDLEWLYFVGSVYGSRSIRTVQLFTTDN